LISDELNVVSTHSTFLNSNDETVDYLNKGNYTLILDEVLEVVTLYNETVPNKRQAMKKGDIELLLNKGLISVDDLGRVSWVDESYSDSQYGEIERLAKSGNLILVKNKLFLWEFPHKLFDTFSEIIVCTYLFNGSILKYFFDYHAIEYELVTVEKCGDRYQLTEYKADTEERAKYKELIDICCDKRLNDYKKAFSSTWYKRATSAMLIQLRNNLRNYLRNHKKAKPKDIMWTTFKKSVSALQGKGYTKIRNLYPEEKLLPERERKRTENQLSCFVPYSARASNDYRERSILAYLCDVWANPDINKFFELKGIKIDKEAYAIAYLIQWIFRSAIRDDKPISLYIPSPRMRGLLNDWLDGRVF